MSSTRKCTASEWSSAERYFRAWCRSSITGFLSPPIKNFTRLISSMCSLGVFMAAMNQPLTDAGEKYYRTVDFQISEPWRTCGDYPLYMLLGALLWKFELPKCALCFAAVVWAEKILAREKLRGEGRSKRKRTTIAFTREVERGKRISFLCLTFHLVLFHFSFLISHLIFKKKGPFSFLGWNEVITRKERAEEIN